jgi:hypothetical protein
MPVDEYLSLLEEQTGRLLSLEKAPTYPQSMTAAWQLSVSQLEDRVPEAVELLRCCAFFGPEPIPRDVFRRGNRLVGPRLAPILSEAIFLTNALSNLERYALVKAEPAARTLQVHRLNQALLRDETPEKDRGELRQEVHLLLAGSAPSDPDDETKWSSFEELAAHLEPSGLISCVEPNVRKFAIDLVRYLYVRPGRARRVRPGPAARRGELPADPGALHPRPLPQPRLRRQSEPGPPGDGCGGRSRAAARGDDEALRPDRGT